MRNAPNAVASTVRFLPLYQADQPPWIESRPTGGGLGRYCFSIDCEGHIVDARVGEALMGLRRICTDVRFLGSYPRADGAPPTMRRGSGIKSERSCSQSS